MKLNTNIIESIEGLRSARNEAKTANKNVETKTDLLVDSIITDGLELYIENKKVFNSYNLFIESYEALLMEQINESEQGIANNIALVIFTMARGLNGKIPMKKIKLAYKYREFIEFANLKKDTNKVINNARIKYESQKKDSYALFADSVAKRNTDVIAELQEVMSIVKKERKKREIRVMKKLEKRAEKRANA